MFVFFLWKSRDEGCEFFVSFGFVFLVGRWVFREVRVFIRGYFVGLGLELRVF